MKIALLVIALSSLTSVLFAQTTRVHLTIQSEEILAGIGLNDIEVEINGAPGVYFIEVETTNGVYAERRILKH